MLSWLRQQIAERKALAESASPWPWSANAEHDEVLAADGERVADGFALSGNQLRNTVDHIAFNDPRQIIADCEAQLTLIGLHEITVKKDGPAVFSEATGKQLDSGYDVSCSVCGWVSDDPESGCETVRLLAMAYAHRPGYLPEWAPEGATA
jgi:hypothetical protein